MIMNLVRSFELASRISRLVRWFSLHTTKQPKTFRLDKFIVSDIRSFNRCIDDVERISRPIKRGWQQEQEGKFHLPSGCHRVPSWERGEL